MMVIITISSLFIMFSFAFPMDLLVDDPWLNSLFSILHEFPLHFKRKRREDVATQNTKKRRPNQTFYALKKSNLENNRAKESSKGVKKKSFEIAFEDKLCCSPAPKLEPFVGLLNSQIRENANK